MSTSPPDDDTGILGDYQAPHGDLLGRRFGSSDGGRRDRRGGIAEDCGGRTSVDTVCTVEIDGNRKFDRKDMCGVEDQDCEQKIR